MAGLPWKPIQQEIISAPGGGVAKERGDEVGGGATGNATTSEAEEEKTDSLNCFISMYYELNKSKMNDLL